MSSKADNSILLYMTEPDNDISDNATIKPKNTYKEKLAKEKSPKSPKSPNADITAKRKSYLLPDTKIFKIVDYLTFFLAGSILWLT